MYCFTHQVSAIGFIFESFFNISNTWAIVLAGGAIVLYCTFGGIKAVTVTDVFQFAFFISVIPILFNLILGNFKDYSVICQALPKTHITIFSKNFSWTSIIVYFLAFCIPYLYPPIIQRLLMCHNAHQAKTIFYRFGTLQIPFYLIVGVIGLMAFAINPNLSTNEVLPFIVNDIIPNWFQTLFIIGLLSAIMSTADSFLHAGSIALIHDCFKPIFKKKVFSSDAKELLIMRWTSFIIGTFAVLWAMVSFNNLFDTFITALIIWNPTMIVPLIGVFIGTKATRTGFIASVLGGGLTALFWNIFIKPHAGIDGQLPGILVNATVFSISCYLNRKAWDFIPSPNRSLFVSFFKKFTFKNLKPLFPTLGNIKHFATTRCDHCPPQYATFSFFVLIGAIIPLFLWSEDLVQSTASLVFKGSAGLLCMLLLLRASLPKKLKAYIPVLWFITILFCLPFTSTYMVLQSTSEHTLWWAMNLSLALMLAAMLLDWISYLIITVLGALSSVGVFSLIHGPSLIEVTPMMFYMWGFSIFLGLVFSRTREVCQLRGEVQRLKAIAGSIAHELRTPLGSIQLGASTVANRFSIPEEPSKEKSSPFLIASDPNALLAHVITNQKRTCRSALNTIDMLLKNISGSALISKLEEISIRDCINETLAEYPFQDGRERSLVEWSPTHDFTFKGDKELFKYVLINLIKNSLFFIKDAQKGKISIWINPDSHKKRLHFKDTAKGMDKETLRHIFKRFYSKRKSGTGLGLSFCKQAVENMGGSIDCKSVQNEYTEFTIGF